MSLQFRRESHQRIDRTNCVGATNFTASDRNAREPIDAVCMRDTTRTTDRMHCVYLHRLTLNRDECGIL